MYYPDEINPLVKTWKHMFRFSIVKHKWIVTLKSFYGDLCRMLQLIQSLLLEWFINTKHLPRTPRTLLIVRLDNIGDYILSRNYFQVIKNSQRFHNYHITFCGNEVCKEIAEQYDHKTVDQFLWVNPRLFQNDRVYRYVILKKLHEMCFEVVINPIYSRESLNEDAIVRITGAQTKIGWSGDLLHASSIERFFANRAYTQLVDNAPTIYFEYYRTRYFFEKVLNTPLIIQNISLPDSTNIKYDPPVAVIGAGAQYAFRRWHINNYLQISDYLFNRYGIHSHYIGNENDRPPSKYMDVLSNRAYILDRIGKTSVVDIIEDIKHSMIVISNETGIAHLSMALNIPTIVISNGNHFGRFTEYPKELGAKVSYVYPSQLTNSGLSFSELVHLYQYKSDLDINTISVETLFPFIERFLVK
jgi:ADP-heptose:LPS heptosyltransferase